MQSRDWSLGEQTSLPTGAEIGFNCLTWSFLLDTTFSGPVLGWPMGGAVFSRNQSLISRDWFSLEWRSILTVILIVTVLERRKAEIDSWGSRDQSIQEWRLNFFLHISFQFSTSCEKANQRRFQ